jgi:tetratricopeptide (TPR) repeat protein
MVHTATAMEGMMARLAGAGLAVGFYFAKCVFPAELLPVYPRWAVDPPSAVQFLPWIAIGAAFGVVWMRRATWGRHAGLGAGCFVINLAPVLGFIPMAYLHISRVADHLVYLPLAGLAGLTAAAAGAAQTRLAAPLRPYAAGGALLAMGLLAFQSHRYAGCFRNQETLWTYTLERNPGAWIAHNNLGFARFEAGRTPEAMAEYEAALRINPDSGDAHNNLANALFRGGRLEEAIHHYEAALRINPGAMEVHSNLANALMKTGRVKEAVGHYETAVRINPDSAAAQSDLGYVLLSLGRAAEAAVHYEAAVRTDPDSAETQSNLGYVLLALGRIGEATAHYQEALRIDPEYAPARSTLARLQTLQHAVEPNNGRKVSAP